MVNETIIQKLKKTFAVYAILALIIVLIPSPTNATLSALSDQMTRLKELEASNHTITFTSSLGVDAAETIILTFPTGFDVNAADNLLDYTDVDVTDDGGELTLGSSASGATWGVGVTASAITLTSGTGSIAGGSVIVFEIGTNALSGATGDKQIVNQTVAQNNSDQKIVISGSFGESGSIAVVIITDDQIPVSATVDPTITFTVVNTTLALGALSASTIRTSAWNDITIGTNASNGYTITIQDIGSGASPGLYKSVAPTKLISSTDTTLLGDGSAERYGQQCNKSSGDGTCATLFSGEIVQGLLLAGETFASYGSKPSATDTFQVRVKGEITTSTPAGSYADILTLLATGNF